MKRAVSLLLIVILAALCIPCGCAARDCSVVVDGFTSSLDPQIESGKTGSLIFSLLYRGLLSCDENGELFADAAEQYFYSADKTRLTFVLRNGLLWENGEKVTSEDYAYAIKRVLAPETASPYAELLFAISGAKDFNSGAARDVSGISCAGESSLILTLDRPDELLLYNFAAAYLAPCDEEFFLSTEGAYGMTVAKTLFNGPYTITARGTSSITLKRLDSADASLPQKIVLTKTSAYTEASLSTRLNKAKTAAALTSVSLNTEADVKAINSGNLTWAVTFGSTGKITGSQSFAYALARGGIGDMQQQNGVSCLMPQQYAEFFLETKMPARLSDYTTARSYINSLLADNKLSAMPEVIMLVPDEEVARAISDRLVESWQKNIGVFVNRKYYSRSKIASLVQEGDYDLALMPVEYTSATPAGFYNSLSASLGSPETISEGLSAITASGAADYSAAAEQLFFDSGKIFPVALGYQNCYISVGFSEVFYYEPRMGSLEHNF